MTGLVEMRNMLIAWGIGVLTCLAAIIGCLMVSPFVMPAADPYGLYRYFVIRLSASAFGIVAVTGGALFFDYVTPGEWFNKIEEGNVACAIVTVGVILTIGLVLCFV